MRLSPRSFLALSLRVDRGILYSIDNRFNMLVRLCSVSAIALRTSSWLSFRVRRIRWRRSSTPPDDIGVDALPSQLRIVWFRVLNSVCVSMCLFGVCLLFVERLLIPRGVFYYVVWVVGWFFYRYECLFLFLVAWMIYCDIGAEGIKPVIDFNCAL